VESNEKLDAPRRAEIPCESKLNIPLITIFEQFSVEGLKIFLRHIVILSAIFLSLLATLPAQAPASVDALVQQQRWQDIIQQLGPLPTRSAGQEYALGLAFAGAERWPEARSAMLRGRKLDPSDKRFPVELAGITFKQGDQREALRWIHNALRLDPGDNYSNDFAGTLYFLAGNLEAAVQYWNRTGKPRIASLRNGTPLRIRPALLDHAFAYGPASVLELDQLRATRARLDLLGVFPSYQLELDAREDGSFDSEFRAAERNRLGNSKLEALLQTFRGLPFQEVTPEYDNLHRSAINIASIFRWDPDKRRYVASISGPLRGNPAWRYKLSGGELNENWEIRQSFTGQAPLLASTNLRRQHFNAELSRLIGWRWRWTLGAELSHRDFRNVQPGLALSPPLLASGSQLKQTAGLEYQFWRSAVHRASTDVLLKSDFASLWSEPNQSFAKFQGGIRAHWFPQARGGDYETDWGLSAGTAAGELPFDELYMVGVERDNNLWLRAHIGTRDGRKGSAPLVRGYFLSNWQTDKILYSNGLITVKIGPFVDTAKLSNSISGPQSTKWLWDAGGQATVRVLGVGATFIYGKDLRTGNNAFYFTVSR
jgi:tetratricopeptide (TPR) repeat protein